MDSILCYGFRIEIKLQRQQQNKTRVVGGSGIEAERILAYSKSAASCHTLTLASPDHQKTGFDKRRVVDHAPWWSGRLGGESFLYRSKIDEASSQTRSKIVPTSVQHRSKIDQQSSQNRQNEGPGSLLDHLWRISGPKVAQGSIFGRF